MNLSDGLNDMISYIENHLEEEISMKELAVFLGCSSYTMQRIFCMMTGLTVIEYIRRRRLSLSALRLLEGKKVIEVAILCGYSSSSAFSRKFYETFGIHPKDVKKRKIELSFQPILKFQNQNYEDSIHYRIEDTEVCKFYGNYIEIEGDIPSKAEVFWDEFKKKYPIVMQDLPRYAVLETKKETVCYWILLKEKQSDLQEFSLPKGKWLVFRESSFKGKNIEELCNKINVDYLKAVPYRRNKTYTLELYYQDFMEIWILIN